MTQIDALKRELTAKRPEHPIPTKGEKKQGLKGENTLDFSRSYDVKKAFDLATRAVKKGVVSPSKFGLQKFVRKEFGVVPAESDLIAWQERWLEMGLIEPTIKNGKQTYKLLVTKG